MAKVISTKEIEKLLKEQEQARSIKTAPIHYESEILRLKKGEALLITEEEFKDKTELKSPIPTYFNSKFKAKDNDIIMIRKTQQGYLLIRK